MPHNNGLIYIDTSVTPNIGINVQSDIGYVLGTGSGDIGTNCQSPLINIYAKYKPVRWSSLEVPNDSYRLAMRWGLYLNSTIVLSASYQDPYWKYNRPRGVGGGDNGANEYYRTNDFNNYNQNAECPMLKTNIQMDGYGAIHIDLTTIMNDSAGVEIPITDVFDFPDADYIGFVLWDATQKFGYYLITDVKVSDVVNGTIDTTLWYDFNEDIISLPFANGDIIEFFWCTNNATTIVHDQDGDRPIFESLTSGTITTISLMACDSKRGHCLIEFTKLDIYTHLSFSSEDTSVGGAWNASQTVWTLNSFITDILCSYTWPRGSTEGYEMSWRIYDGNNDIFTGSGTLSMASATDSYHLSLNNGSKEYALADLIDDNYIITLYLYGKLTGSTNERLFATINYNVQTGTIV